MKRLLLPMMAIASAALTLGGTAMAQEKPEFTLGFMALASQISDVVGTPLEVEHYDSGGDSLQRTSTGLMVWRKEDNWTAFTNGSRSWVNGPFGLQERGNDERLDWETETTLPMAAPTPAPVTASAVAPSPAPAATPTPNPTPQLRPSLSSSQPNVIQGRGLEANSVWVLGEVHNEGRAPAYNVTVTARLLTDSGTVVGTANHAFAFLGAGDSVGYRVDVRNAAAYERADVSIGSSSSGFANFARLPIAWVKNEKTEGSQSDIRYEFTGTIDNSGGQPVSLSAVYVWFLDDQDRVVWAEQTYIPTTLASGDSSAFVVRTAEDGANPRVSAIIQVRYYAAGQLP